MRFGKVLFLSLVSFIVGVFVFLYTSEYTKLLKIRNRALWMQNTVAMLKRENDELVGKVKLAETPYYVESVARESLGMSRPNEKVYYIILKK